MKLPFRAAPSGAKYALLLALVLTVAAGCSVRRYAVNMVGDALAAGNSVYETDEDLELVGQALPFGLKLMESLLEESPDHAGLLLTSWAVWLAASIGLAPFSGTTIFAAVALAAALNYAAASARSGVREFLRHKARIVVAEEYLFLLAFLAWAFLRSVKPEVDSIEKFMDLGFVNAVLRAEWMPPADMWLSGKPINYYYFGHVFTAFLCRLARVPSEIGFNLMIATLFAFAVSLPYSIVSSLLRRVDPRGVKKAVAGGLLAASLLAAGGTLHPFIYGALLPTLKNAGLYEGEVKSYWYWDATRFIGYHPPSKDKTIHEVPLFTFVLGELHGHALDIPAVLAATGIGSALLLSPGAVRGASPLRVPYAEAVGGVLLMGAMLPIVNGSAFALVQTIVPAGMQGRVLTLMMSLSMVVAPLGLAAAGPLADVVGVQTWYLAAGVLMVGVAALGLSVPDVVHMEKWGEAYVAGLRP